MRAAVLGAAALALTACSSSTPTGDYRFSSAQQIGTVIPVARREPAEVATGTLLSGGPFRLRAGHGKVTVVNFWASWCGPCQAETPDLESLSRADAGRVSVLGINTKDAHSAAASFVAAHHVTYPVVYDEEGRVSTQLGDLNLPGLPYTMLIDKQGRVAAVWSERALTTGDLQPVLHKLEAER